MRKKLTDLASTEVQIAPSRSGLVMVWFAFMLVMLLGMVGLVVDGGIVFSAHRHAQSAADAAALAYAMDKLLGQTDATAAATAETFVKQQQYNDLPNATVVLNVPPATGPHQGMSGHVEAIVTSPIRTVFIHILGVSRIRQVSARAVATWIELRTAGEGAIVLDPRRSIAPGLAVGGNGRLVVQGGVFDNNEGEGWTENYDPVDTDGDGDNNSIPAATGGQQNSENGVYSDNIRIVGGVDDPAMFKNIDTGINDPNVLHTKQLPLPDPLASLATPTLSSGVVDSGLWPDVSVGSQDTDGDGIHDSLALNVSPQEALGTSVNVVDGWVILNPDVYKRITITGDPNIAQVRFQPGIHVLKAGGTKGIVVNGGTVIGEGVMIYNTGANYDPASGTPDINDPFDPMGLQPPPAPNKSGTTLGDVTLNSLITLTPIDTTNPEFAPFYPSGIEVFDGMLFYQRRGNAQTVALQGNGIDTLLGGTIYAKWARFKLQGWGNYDAQFIVGSMDIQGNGDVTLQYTGQGRGLAPTVFLVE